MHLKLQQISLVQFKNYGSAEFRFDQRIVGICGRNGVGKTNLLDAIYYLCFTKSYFTRSDTQNVLSGHLGFRIHGEFDRRGELATVVCILRESGKKEVYYNDDLYEKLATHIGKFPCVIIAPDDVETITGGSEGRRRFLDALLSQLDQDYLQNLIDYNRVLQQRNGYLKSLGDKRIDESLLQIYNEQLGRYGEFIFEKRTSFLQSFIPEVIRFYDKIALSAESINLTYDSQLTGSTFPELFRRFRERDIYLQRTNGGIHKDDLEITMQQQPFRNIASQGQRKSMLFALKLAEFDALKQAKGSPLLLLDDVFEKLDEKRMHNLLEWVCLQNEGQIFITDTHEERIREHLGKIGAGFQLIRLG